MRRSLGCLAAGAGCGLLGAVVVPAGRSQDGAEFVGAEPCADGDLDDFERIFQVGKKPVRDMFENWKCGGWRFFFNLF